MIKIDDPDFVASWHKVEEALGCLDENQVVSYLQDGGDTIRKVSYQEIERIHLNPKNGVYACQVPKGAWHKVEVYEPSVIFEAKDGAYGSDGSEAVTA